MKNEEWIESSFVPESFQLCLIVCPPLRWLPYSVRVVDFGGKLILATKRNQPRRQMKKKPKSVMNTLITVYRLSYRNLASILFLH